jgi:hypothetical protein
METVALPHALQRRPSTNQRSWHGQIEIANAVDGEQIGKPGPPAMEAALNSTGRTTADSCGFVMREVRSADEDQRFTLLYRELR